MNTAKSTYSPANLSAYMRKPAAMTPMWPNLFTMGDMKIRKGRALAAPMVTVRPMRERDAPRSPRNQNRNASRNPKNAPEVRRRSWQNVKKRCVVR